MQKLVSGCAYRRLKTVIPTVAVACRATRSFLNQQRVARSSAARRTVTLWATDFELCM